MPTPPPPPSSEVDLIIASLTALESSNFSPAPQTLPANATSTDYLHHGVRQPVTAKPKVSSNKVSTNPSKQKPLHYDSSHPNPSTWLPTSHYPKNPPLPAAKPNKPVRTGGLDAGVDEFVETIADLLTSSTPTTTQSSSAPSGAAHMSHDEISKILRSSLSSSSVLRKGSDKKERKEDVIRLLYDAFLSASSDKNNAEKRGSRSTTPTRSRSTTPNASRSTTPTRRSTTPTRSHEYPHSNPNHPYPPPPPANKPFDKSPAPQPYNTGTPAFPKAPPVKKWSAYHEGGRPVHLDDSQSSIHMMRNANDPNMANLYHVINTAFLLIESERDQYTHLIESASETSLRARYVALIVIFNVCGGFVQQTLRRSFGKWFKLTLSHKQWLQANALTALRETYADRRMQTAMNAIKKMTGDCIFKSFKMWKKFTEDAIKERVTLQRFGYRLIMRSAVRCLNRWTEYAALRKKMRGFLNRMIGGKRVRQISAAFGKWKNGTVNRLEREDIERQLTEALEKMNAMEIELNSLRGSEQGKAAEEKRKLLRRTIYRMLNSAVGSAFHNWIKNAERWKAQQIICEKAARRWQLAGCMRVFNKWTQMAKERKWLRSIMNRMLGTKEIKMKAAALWQFKRVTDFLGREGVTVEVATLREKNAELEEALLRLKLESNDAALRRVKKTIESMRSSCLKSTLHAWMKFVADEKSDRLKGTRFLAKLMRGLETRCFAKWVEFAKERMETRRLVKRVFARMLSRKEVMAWRSWTGWVKEEQRNEFVMRRVGMKILMGTLTRCVRTWVEFTKESVMEKKEEIRREMILKRAVARMTMAAVSKCFHGLASYACQSKRERHLLKKFGARMKMKTVFNCLNNWRNNVQHIIYQKQLCWRVMCRMANSQTAGAWKAWSELVREQQREEERAAWESQQVGLLGMAQAQERNKSRRDQARQRQESEEEKRERVGKSIMVRIMYRSVSNAWAGWMAYIERRQRAKYLCGKVVGRICGGLTGMGFHTWRSLIEHQKWQTNVLSKFVAKMKNQKLFKMFTLWGRWVAEEKRYKVVVGRFLSKLKNRFVLAVFRTWLEFKNSRRWLRGLLNKMVGGREFKMCSSAWVSWTIYVRDCKMMEALVDNGDEVARLKQALALRGQEAEAESRTKIRLTQFFSKICDRDAEFWLSRRAMQYAFLRWSSYKKEDGIGGILQPFDVDRIDNYMVMFAHAFNNVHQISSLFAVAAVSVAHMLKGARGSLFLIDKRSSEVFTVSGSAVKRGNMGTGIIGHCARTGESVFGDMFLDERFDERIDGMCLSLDFFATTNSHIITSTSHGLVAGTSPKLLCIAVRNCEGGIIGVLAATMTGANPIFSQQDCLVMHLMSTYIASNIEKIAAKKVLKSASHNIVACENTLRREIERRTKENSSSFSNY